MATKQKKQKMSSEKSLEVFKELPPLGYNTEFCMTVSPVDKYVRRVRFIQ